MCTVLINKYSWTRKTYICGLDFVEMVKAWHKNLTNQSSMIKKKKKKNHGTAAAEENRKQGSLLPFMFVCASLG